MKKSYLAVIIVLIVLGIIGIIIYKKTKEENSEIEKYEIQTHEYFDNGIETTNFYIDSVEELETFYALYSNQVNIDKTKLENHTIFIKIEVVSSGSIQMKLTDVTFEGNTVNFKINKKEPEIGTSDMAFWYLVAIIPHQKVKGLDRKDWKKPSEIKKTQEDTFKIDSENKFEIITDFRWKTMLDDGGSNTSIYYQIDLDHNRIKKIQEDYHANLGGTPMTNKKITYTKNIEKELSEEIKLLFDEVIDKEDINDTHNYDFFTIKTFQSEKKIYNENTINQINELLTKIDEN